METINSVASKKISKLLIKNFAFFAFSTKQFNEASNVNFTYVSCANWMFAPKELATNLIKAMTDTYEKAGEFIKQKEPQKERIWCELAI